MKIVVTGGTGFIGSALCRYLVGQCHDSVLNIDKLTYAANPATLDSIQGNPGYQFLKADICDRVVMDRVLEAFFPDAVIHLAAESHVDRSITGAADFIQTNIIGTYTLLEAAHSYWLGLDGTRQKAFRFLHVSTDEVYGSLEGDGLFTEQTAYDPSSPYSASKAASDHLVMAWHRTHGFPAMVSNCSNNYGPYQFPEKLVPLFCINALKGKPLPVYGDGSNIRDWLHVDDHARALRLIVDRGRPGEKYNVGGLNERTNMQVILEICALMDRYHPGGAPHEQLITHVKDRPGHDQRYAIDARKIKTELGWTARHDLESGLEATIEWYLQNRDWWKPLHNTEEPPVLPTGQAMMQGAI